MKANLQKLSMSAPWVLTLALSACAPPPAVVPAPVAVPPRAAPPPVAKPLDWQTAPLAQGQWQLLLPPLGAARATAQARFSGQGQNLLIRCQTAVGQVQILFSASPSAALTPSLAITTLRGQRMFDAKVTSEGALQLDLPAHDRQWDTIAFARGRWMVEVPGLAPLILPATPELGRVVDDCRQSGAK